MSKGKNQQPFASRIVGDGEEAPDQLLANPLNWRRHPKEQQDALEGMLRTVGWVQRVIVNRTTGHVVDGHLRVELALRRGEPTVPVIYVELSETEERAVLAAIDPIGGMAVTDQAQLDELLDGLVTGDEGLDALLDSLKSEDAAGADSGQNVDADPDSIPPVDADVVTKPGSVWVLGRHRIICGSCRDQADVARLLDGAKINLAFTSPPYASQRAYDESSGFRPINPDQYVDWYADVSANIRANLADDGSYFCNIKEHADDGVRHTYVKRLLLTHSDAWGWRWVDEFVWIRQGIPGDAEGMGRFRNAWESIFWFAKNKRPKFNPKAVRHESEGAFSYADQVAAGKTIGAKNQGAGSASNSPVGHGHGLAYPSNVLDLKQKAETLGHAAAFPVVLPEFFLKAYTDEGDTVFDPFMGSGSTLMAAEKNGRIAYGTEISPAYCDVIVRRWQAFTGKQATLESDGRTFDEVAAESVAEA